MKKAFVLFAGVSLLTLSCVLPEKFTCSITVDKRGAYSIDFKGTFFLWIIGMEEEEVFSPEADIRIKEIFDAWAAEEPAVKKYEYRYSCRAYYGIL